MSDMSVNETIATADEDWNLAGLSEDDVSGALLLRFTRGVEAGEWTVIALGDARSMRIGPEFAEQLGVSDSDHLILLIAKMKDGRTP